MRRMTGLRVDPDGTRHSVWRDEGAAQLLTTTRTLSGTPLAANQSAASAELKRAANRRANARYRGKA